MLVVVVMGDQYFQKVKGSVIQRKNVLFPFFQTIVDKASLIKE
jgi:hypothetical protein